MAAYDISSGTFSQIALSVSAQSTDPSSILYNADGSVAYLLSASSDDIKEFALSTPYDLSTGAYTQIALDISGQSTAAVSFIFNNDGTTLYVLDLLPDNIYEYALSTAYDISTATYTQVALYVGAQDSTPRDFKFNGDGTKLYLLGDNWNGFHEYALSAAYDISSATYTQLALSVSVQEPSPSTFLFSADGSALYVLGYANVEIYEYALSTAYDISTATYTQVALSVITEGYTPNCMLFNGDGSALYILESDGDDVNEYTIPVSATAAKGIASLEINVEYPAVKGVANLEINVEHSAARGVVWLDIETWGDAKGTAALEINVAQPAAKGSAPIQVTVSGASKGVVQLSVQVIDTTSPYWRLAVVLNSVDITARITGEPRISESENGSTLLDIDILPQAGTFDPLAWVGQSISLDYMDCAADGSERWRERQFTGVVSEPTHNPDTGIISLTCTTDLQGRFTDTDREAIALAIGGRYSPHVFDDEASNWQYAQDRLSTRTAFMWIDANGQLQVTDWAAKATPDITITDAGRIADSTRITRANKSQLINQIQIDMDFRFERFKQRNVRYRFQWSDTICAYLQAQFQLPQKTMVQSAAEGGGWELLGGIHYINPWPPGVYNCGTSATGARDIRVWGYTPLSGPANPTTAATLSAVDPNINDYCIGASFTLGQRWTQTVTETYSLKVRAPSSISGNGQRAESQEYGIEAESEPNYWESDSSYRWKYDGAGATTSVSGAISSLPTGAVELSNGDWLYEASDAEQTGRAAMEEAQLCALEYAKVDILNRHRQNRVRFSIPYQPGVWLGKTTRLVTPYVTATGVISEIERRFNIATGLPQIDITIAVSRRGAAGVVTETPLEIVEAPASDPLTEYDSLVYLPFRIGGRIASPAYDEDWDGVIVNYFWDPTDTNPFSTDPDDPKTVIYPESVKVNTQEITAADRQAISAQADQIFEIDIPEDELTEVA